MGTNNQRGWIFKKKTLNMSLGKKSYIVVVMIVM